MITSNLSMRERTSQDHLYWLDWLRFIAAFMILAIHARGGTWVDWSSMDPDAKNVVSAVFFALTRAGTEWVLVFFVLSGYLVGGRLLIRFQSGSFDLRSYYIDRATRLWVPLVPALGWSAAVYFWIGLEVNWWHLPGNILGLQGVLVQSFSGNYPLWSLAYEIWFYCLAGGLAAWLTSGGKNKAAAALVVVAALAVFTILDVSFLFVWLVGAMFYGEGQPKSRKIILPLALILIGVGYTTTQLHSATVSIDTSGMSSLLPPPQIGILILGLGVALILPLLTSLRPRSRFLVRIHGLGTALAAFSYTLYLTHYPLLYLFERYVPLRYSEVSGEAVGVYLARIAICLVFAWLFYLPFEARTDTIRNWLKRRER